MSFSLIIWLLVIYSAVIGAGLLIYIKRDKARLEKFYNELIKSHLAQQAIIEELQERLSKLESKKK